MRFSFELHTVSLAHANIDLFAPEQAAVKAAYLRGDISFPYWSRVWPSAKALAGFLLSNPEFVAGKSVVELGAGLGLPSLVAARFAASVLCTDSSEEAMHVMEQSIGYHGYANANTAVLDWHRLPAGLSADVLLLSDVNYEPEAFSALQTVIQKFLAEGTQIILSTPQRLMAKPFVGAILPFCVLQEEIPVENNSEKTLVSLMVLSQPR